jgi:hypothetical protein
MWLRTESKCIFEADGDDLQREEESTFEALDERRSGGNAAAFG